jgi:hypothetical protein
MTGVTYTQALKECFRKPMQNSYWDPANSQFVCPDEIRRRTAQQHENFRSSDDISGFKLTHAKYFKMVFLSCFILTLIFTTICYGLTISYEGKPPGLTEELVKNAADI